MGMPSSLRCWCQFPWEGVVMLFGMFCFLGDSVWIVGNRSLTLPMLRKDSSPYARLLSLGNR